MDGDGESMGHVLKGLKKDNFWIELKHHRFFETAFRRCMKL